MSFPTVSPIVGGYVTLPEKFLVKTDDETSTRKVPALSFLITHTDVDGRKTRMLFDLGIMHEPDAPIRNLEWNNWEVDTRSNVLGELKKNDIKMEDIDVVILSHCHFDHSGDARIIPAPTLFLVGPGTIERLDKGLRGAGGPPQDLLPTSPADNRTIELCDSSTSEVPPLGASTPLNLIWSEFSAQLPHRVIDLFSDQSIYVVDAPGHVAGHINLLVRIGEGDKFVYLAGDSCHDVRILKGSEEMGTWKKAGEDGRVVCPCSEASMHEDLKRAEQHVKDIGKLVEFVKAEGGSVEVVIAHDGEWTEKNKGVFLPEKM